MPSGEDTTAVQVLLAEYDRIKEEQKSRIGFRDNLLYVTLAAMVAVVVAVGQTRNSVFLLTLPAISFILGWTYFVNDVKIRAIGQYVQSALVPRLSELTQSRFEAFGWEIAHRSDVRYLQRRTIQCLVDLAAFVLMPLTALAAYWLSGPSLTFLLLAVSLLETSAVVLLAFEIILHTARLGRIPGFRAPRRTSRRTPPVAPLPRAGIGGRT
ncbi:hypothetical protein ACFRR7_21205 [Streptomyces sp. NPDC056909]|uniref:hypothetical protein n=1 Tax=Streptomyces sp. NPDC056909 TaxID=3345963 RepID=UPI0036D0BA12